MVTEEDNTSPQIIYDYKITNDYLATYLDALRTHIAIRDEQDKETWVIQRWARLVSGSDKFVDGWKRRERINSKKDMVVTLLNDQVLSVPDAFGDFPETEKSSRLLAEVTAVGKRVQDDPN